MQGVSLLWSQQCLAQPALLSSLPTACSSWRGGGQEKHLVRQCRGPGLWKLVSQWPGAHQRGRRRGKVKMSGPDGPPAPSSLQDSPRAPLTLTPLSPTAWAGADRLSHFSLLSIVQTEPCSTGYLTQGGLDGGGIP